MPLPQKRWFRIADIATRWAIPLSDIEDYALDELLELAVFVVDVPAEAGSWEPGPLGNLPLLQDQPILNGPQPLPRASLLEIFRGGEAEVGAFRTSPHTFLHVAPGVPALVVRRDDLIVTREERDRFERQHGSAAGPTDGVPIEPAIWHSDDFTSARIAGEWHSFGPKQAAVLRLLTAAAATDKPWCDGKRLLQDSGASTMRLVDLFKRKPEWRQLVLADGKGRYRLNPDLLAREGRRVRLFRRLNQRVPKQRGVTQGAPAEGR
ncbi:MAG: hypothetical protein AB7I59_04615 [Geminicoccaceae bacterium]